MSEPVITVQGLGKKYKIGGAKRQPYLTLRDTLSGLFRKQCPDHAPCPKPHAQNNEFYALKDVSFTVNRGEVVGVIGRNGAGKSTLLKILSRITEPTEGRVEIKGRVGSLLEVGTGFHPELSGRENIFLNGAILGMGKKEIERKFDEIVAFAEIEKFIDTPVKHYSSGMYVRLAFAVAAHLEPEILLVDEVLAVGDHQFQQKCLGKMGDVARSGRTVLFVSHNMAAIENLCTRGIILDRGGLVREGATGDVIAWYISSMRGGGELSDLSAITARKGTGGVRFRSVWFEDDEGGRMNEAQTGKPLTFVFVYDAQDGKTFNNVTVGFTVRTIMGSPVFLHCSSFTGVYYNNVRGRGEFRCRLPRLPLTAGRYTIGINVSIGAVSGIDVADELSAGEFTVIEGDYYGTGSGGVSGHSPVLVDGEWRND